VVTKLSNSDQGYDSILVAATGIAPPSTSAAIARGARIATEAWAPPGGRGRTPTQVLITWDIQLGNIVIPKSVNSTRIASNFDVFDFERSASNSAPKWRRSTRAPMGPEWVRIREPSISQVGE
jgi:2,5-diketo-D-gluconate reductase A